MREFNSEEVCNHANGRVLACSQGCAEHISWGRRIVWSSNRCVSADGDDHAAAVHRFDFGAERVSRRVPAGPRMVCDQSLRRRGFVNGLQGLLRGVDGWFHEDSVVCDAQRAFTRSIAAHARPRAQAALSHLFGAGATGRNRCTAGIGVATLAATEGRPATAGCAISALSAVEVQVSTAGQLEFKIKS